jgi:outer membrane protein OmpA-like peptidoglycan-associated protein/ABC-type nitrate/sulfonate/bicarbonate transport system substrate-binding protein
MLAIAAVWLVLLGVLAAGYKLFVAPNLEGDLIDATGSNSQYDHAVKLALDGFSGYAIFRSEPFAKLLKKEKIKIELEDDQADYEKRLKRLAKGKTQLAVFTVDAYLYAGAKAGKFPASMVMAIDETVGADAIVAYAKEVPNLTALDRSSTRIVATPSSPSEFLARTMIATLSLPKLPEKWLDEADGAEDVYKRFKTASGDARKHAYVLWEPYVSKALDIDGAHTLLDSSKMQGYIIDVLVAEREFLRDHPDIVAKIVEAYLRTAWSYDQEPGGMVRLMREDSKELGQTLNEKEAEQLVNGIRWKNTLENYAHFALGEPAPGIDSMEDVIGKIADVLVRTGAVDSNPVDGQEATLFYKGALDELQSRGFHPGKKVEILAGVGPGTDDLNAVRETPKLPALDDTGWNELESVASMRVEPIGFRRGTAEISEFSRSELDALARRFNSLPTFYMKVVGHALAEGDPEANARLAQERAQAVRDYLISAGVDENRLSASSSVKTGGEAEVAFVLGRSSY